MIPSRNAIKTVLAVTVAQTRECAMFVFITTTYFSVHAGLSQFFLLDTTDMEVVFEGRDSRHWIRVCCFSPHGETFAMGSTDNKIYIYDSRSNALRSKVSYKRRLFRPYPGLKLTSIGPASWVILRVHRAKSVPTSAHVPAPTTWSTICPRVQF